MQLAPSAPSFLNPHCNETPSFVRLNSWDPTNDVLTNGLSLLWVLGCVGVFSLGWQKAPQGRDHVLPHSVCLFRAPGLMYCNITRGTNYEAGRTVLPSENS